MKSSKSRVSTTPTQRTTRSNSQADLTLDNIKAIVETAKLETMTAFREEITSLKTELKSHIATLTARVDKLEHKYDDLLNEFNSLKSSSPDPLNNEEMFLAITQEVEQRHYRCQNVIIRGVPELQTGSVDARTENDNDFSSKLFNYLGSTDVEIVSTRRLGKQRSDNKRPLCVRLSTTESRHEILRNAKKLRQNPSYEHCYVNPDLTNMQRHIDANLRKELRRLRESGRNVVIYKGKIVDRDEGFLQ